MRNRRIAAALAVLLTLAGCSDDATPKAQSSPTAQGTLAATAPTGSAAASSSTAPAATLAPGTTAVPAPGTTAKGLPSQTSPTPVSTAPPGPQARKLSAAPGRYTVEVRGTVNGGNGDQRTDGDATLTVDPPTGDDQHSLLDLGQYGSTEQTARFSASAIQLVQLKIGSSGFAKEFRPVKPVLLLPQPPTAGREWSWTIVSTDGATTAAVSARITRSETIAIGGERVACTLVHATLKLSGDINATSVLDTWYADRYHLSVREHTVTDGMFGTFSFHSDTTTTLRSAKPA